MIEEEGIVVEATGDFAEVAIQAKSGCEACAASGVCHPGEQENMKALNPLGAKKGQKVKVALAPQIYLKASLILYGFPMVSFIAAAIIGKNLAIRYGAEANSDLWAFLAGTACLVAAFVFIRMYNKKVEKTGQYQPTIIEILG